MDFVFFLLMLLGLSSLANGQLLQMGFYDQSCPRAEVVVKDYVTLNLIPTLAAPLLRMHFHDCFVNGCDGSILLDSTEENTGEKQAPPNLTLRGFDFIDRVKAEVEKECPGIVSCADVLALVARDAVEAMGGPTWKVPTGRRDGDFNGTSKTRDIPAPTFNFSSLVTNFEHKGLGVKDLVVLSGAHTMGIAHCGSFSQRLFNFTGKGDVDPSLDGEYAENLKLQCKTPTDNTTLVEMDPESSNIFDLSYYSLLLKKRGLFQSDSALTQNETSLSLINQLLSGSVSNFYEEFGISMEKVGRIGVKIGGQGEVRKNCRVMNEED